MTAKGDVEREIRTQAQRLQNSVKITGKVFRDWDDLNVWLGDYCRKVRTLRASVGCGMILGESTRRRAIPRADLLSQNLDQQVTARLATT